VIGLFSFMTYRSTRQEETETPEVKKAPKEETKNPQISLPFNFRTDYSITFNPVTCRFEGVPEPIQSALEKSGLSYEEVIKDPLRAKDILYSFNYDEFRNLSISSPFSGSHNIHISIKDGKIQGIPVQLRTAINASGYTDEQIIKNPILIRDLLYSYEMEEVLSHHVSGPVISAPESVSHDFSINYDPETGRVTGVPEEIMDAIQNAGYTIEQVVKDPLLVKNLLYNFDYDSLKPNAPKISGPVNVTHDFSLHFNEATGEVKGVPQEILDAIKNAGHTIEEVVKSPHLIKEILYNFDYNSLKPDALKISAPLQATHDFHIEFDNNGNPVGVPPAILSAISKSGYTMDQIKENPLLIKDILYSLDYSQVKESALPQISKPTEVKHDFSIKYDPSTGKVEGIPEVIRKACIEKGLTEKQVLNNPELVSELLYTFDYNSLKKQ